MLAFLTLSHRALVPLVLAVAGGVACEGCIPKRPVAMTGAPLVAGFTRGINAGNALDAPTEGAWGPALDEAYFDAVAAAGFDHVRIPIRWNAHAAAAPPYTVDEAFFAR